MFIISFLLLPLVLFCSSMNTILRQLLNLFIFNLDIWPSIQQIQDILLYYRFLANMDSKTLCSNITSSWQTQLECHYISKDKYLSTYRDILNSVLSEAERHPGQYGTQIVIKGQREVSKQKLGKVVLDKENCKDKVSTVVICVPLSLQFKQLSNYIHSFFTHGKHSYKLINTK